MNRFLFFLFPVLVIAVATAGDSSPSPTDALTQEQTIALLASGRNLQQGCCSWHDGVCGCSGGRTLCCDGEFSPSCMCSADNGDDDGDDDDDDDDDDNLPPESQQGCCSWYSGVWGCSGGRTLCRDNCLSPSCRCGDGNGNDETIYNDNPPPEGDSGPFSVCTRSSTPRPTLSPTPRPTLRPTLRPTPSPTSEPTPRPTPSPTSRLTTSPALEPTPGPTTSRTSGLTPSPTSEPTPGPTTESPTPKPTKETETTVPLTIESPTPKPTKGTESGAPNVTIPSWAIVVIMLLVFLVGLVSGLNFHYCCLKQSSERRSKVHR